MLNQSPFYHFPSPAKLNLFLHIVGQKADGYHELETVFQFLEHGDTLSIRATNTGKIDLLTPINGVKNEDNLIIKAAKLLQSTTKVNKGAEIKINKVLPMGGGLGGGSSNAATVLVALNYLWNTNLSTSQLTNIGVSLGADVPIFVEGFAAFAQGIGEQLTPVCPKEFVYLVSKPQCSISTQAVFNSPTLVRDTPNINIDDNDINQLIEKSHNDCQTLVIKEYPEVANLLAWLIEYAPSRMTGTGACVFSRFESENDAKRVGRLLPKSVEYFVTKGVNLSPLHQYMKTLPITDTHE